MSVYKALRDVSNDFENVLRQSATQLFSAKVRENFEDAVSNRLRDLSLFSSKLKLLRAKPLSLTPQVREQSQDDVLQQYEEVVTLKLLEQMSVKSLTQIHATKLLINTPNEKLDPELTSCKEAIIECLSQHHKLESQLRVMEDLLKEKEKEHEVLRAEWDKLVGVIKDERDQEDNNELGNRGPLYVKLSKLVERLELMRWLIGRLICARGQYDWLLDPHRRLSALTLTRSHNTVDAFTQE